MDEIPLSPYARMPDGYAPQHLVSSTVDAFGHAHWLVADRAGVDRVPYDALVVSREGEAVRETHLRAVRAEPHLDALPDGGFVLAAARSRPAEPQVQVFDALGRETASFRIGDAVEHLLADERGDLWAGHFDEGVLEDPLSGPGLARWSTSGERLWAFTPTSGVDRINDCYALNVGRRAAWACTWPGFPLLEIRSAAVAAVRSTPVAGAHAFAVHGRELVFAGGYDRPVGLLARCRLTGSTAGLVGEARLVLPDGSPLGGPYHLLCRGPRLYVRSERGDWYVLDLTTGAQTR